MANGTSRLALAKMQLAKKQQNESDYEKSITDSRKKLAVGKIPLKNPTKNNHSRP